MSASRPATRASEAPAEPEPAPSASGSRRSKLGTAAERPSSVQFIDHPAQRPSSVAFIDHPASASGRRATFTPDGEGTGPPGSRSAADNPATRPSSVLLIDEPKGRRSRPRTVTLQEPTREDLYPAYDKRDDDLDVEEEVKARLQRELRAVSAKHSAGKELVHQEHQPDQEPARVGTAASKGKPGTARESRSRGRSQQKSRGLPGTIGIKWKEAYRAVVAPTSADTGYRHVLTVLTVVPGGAADATGRVKVGDKLVAVQDSGQRTRKVVIGMQKEEIRRALHGEAGAAISLELLRATDMGAKKAFSVSLVRTAQIKKEGTTLPQIGKLRAPNTPSIKQTGWAKGVRLRADMAPADGDIKEYHSLSEEDEEANGMTQASLVGKAAINPATSDADDAPVGDIELAEEQEELKKLKRLKMSDKLTRKEEEQLEVMKRHKKQLDEESKKHEDRQAHLRAAIQACEDELNQARKLFCDVARRATGEILDPPLCTHKNHGAVHSLQTCMQEFRPIIDAFLTKIEEAPKILPPAIAEERAQEEQEQQYNKEAARELRDSKAALQNAEERQERRIAEMAQELEAQRNLHEEEKMAMKEKTDEEIAALLVKIEMRDKEIESLKSQCEDLRDELDSVVELKDVEEIKLRLLEAELEGGDSDENQLKKVEILKLACRAAALNRDALQEALKDAAVRAQIELLKKHEAELEAEVEKLRAAEDQLHEDEKLHRKFCWSVMINVSKVDPDDVKREEKRQKAGVVEDDEIVAVVKDYVEAAPDDAEIFVRNIQDYVCVRFPFLEITEKHKQIISDTFEDIFKEVPPPTEAELEELARQRLEDEAVDYGYTTKEATGRTAGQLRKMISDARVVARDAKITDRQRREASWEDNSGDEGEPVDSEDSDAVYKSDNPEEDEEEKDDAEEEEDD